MLQHHLTYPDPLQVLTSLEAVQGVLAFAPDGRILAVNQVYCDMCGYASSELIGQPVAMLRDPDDAASVTDPAFLAALHRGEPQIGEFKRRRKDGTPYWISTSFNAVRAENGDIAMIVGYCIDVTAARSAQAAAEARQAAILRSLASVEFTPSGMVTWANEKFLDIMGYTLDEVKGHSHRMFCDRAYTASGDYAEFWADLRAGGTRQIEDRLLAKGGREVWIAGSYCALRDPSGNVSGVVKYATDITQRRQAVASLIRGLTDLSQRDLTSRVPDTVAGEFASVRDSFNGTTAALETLVEEVRARAEHMNGGAGQIAGGASDLARRVESQAASLEETAAAVEQISGNVAVTSQSARDADRAARAALNVVLRGAEVVRQAIAAIERIDEHTKQMGEFTRVIEGFAFQTNLLSINAAVEAARAGEVGRGFAVVANEVRNLAQQSAKASQNIADLISKSEAEVRAGVKLVRDAGTSLDQIQTAVGGVVENITGIAHATTEQATGVHEVSEALSQLDGVNQANLTMSEQYAAAAAVLSTQVEELSAMMDTFRTSSDLIPVAAVRDERPAPRRVPRFPDDPAADFAETAGRAYRAR